MAQIALRLAIAANEARSRASGMPHILTIFCTSACNAKCPHCYYHEELNQKRKELTVDDLRTLGRSVRGRLREVSFTGGEPFARKDLKEMVIGFALASQVRHVGINTNGAFHERTLAFVEEFMSRTRARLSLQFSLDGLAKTHDDFRGLRGNFDQIGRLVRALAGPGHARWRGRLTLSASTVAMAINREEVLALRRHVEDGLGIDHKVKILYDVPSGTFGIDPAILNDFGPAEGDLALPIGELKELFRRLDEQDEGRPQSLSSKLQALVHRHVLRMLVDEAPALRCKAGQISAVIYPDGGVSLCEMTTPVGNLSDVGYDLRAFWSLPSVEARRAKLGHCFCINPCGLIDSIPYDLGSMVSLLGPVSRARR